MEERGGDDLTDVAERGQIAERREALIQKYRGKRNERVEIQTKQREGQ